MGQCCTKKHNSQPTPHKQNKNIYDKRMLKVGIEVLKKDFCVQIGYNRRAVKNYSNVSCADTALSINSPENINNDEKNVLPNTIS